MKNKLCRTDENNIQTYIHAFILIPQKIFLRKSKKKKTFTIILFAISFLNKVQKKEKTDSIYIMQLLKATSDMHVF